MLVDYSKALGSLSALSKMSLGAKPINPTPATNQYQNLNTTNYSTPTAASTPSNLPTNNSLGTVTVPYGGSTRYEKFHPAVDIANAPGTAIPAFKGGTIVEVSTGHKQGDKGSGNYVLIKDDKGNKWRYSHLKDTYVKVGQQVATGTTIGGMGNCFDKDTEILTSNGWYKFPELPEGISVATLNLENNKIEFEKPTAYIKKRYDKMLSFCSDDMDFVVSSDHRMLVQLHQDQKKKFIFAENLPNRCYVPQIVGIYDGIKVNTFSIPSISYKSGKGGKIRKDETMDVNMGDWLEFLGWFLSDGSLQFNEKERRNINAAITQSDRNKKTRLLTELLARLPFNYYKGNTDYRYTKRQLIEYLQNYGVKNKKTVPNFIFFLHPTLINRFLKGYFLGDGWLHKGTQYCVFGWHEKALLDQIQHLIFLSGGWSTYSTVDPTKYNKTRKLVNNKRIIAKNKIYALTVRRERFTGIVKSKTRTVEYDDFAYCVTVPNSTLYVRRNGRPMWCGNSGATYSTSGGTGTHLDIRITDAYNKYINPTPYISSLLQNKKA